MVIDNQQEEIRKQEKFYESISPFEFKNNLIQLAQGSDKKAVRAMLNAGRGNPNWVAATPRDAFFTLGHFAVTESRRVWDEGDLAGKPQKQGIYDRFIAYVQEHKNEAGSDLLHQVVEYGVKEKQFEPDAFVYELVDGIIGDNYPVPDRMLVHAEQIAHDYVVQEMCDNDASVGHFHLFAVEGATAAMCYLFDSLRENYLLNRGDKVAVMVPIFPPYVEIPHLARYDFDVVEIRALGVDNHGDHTWQYPDVELEKLKDPDIQALFLVNPSNPPSVAMNKESVQHLLDVVKKNNPNLMIISDDVYGTFVEHYRSLMADLTYNTVGVYSFSKYFGVTGWRLGVIAIHEKNVFDDRLRSLSDDKKAILKSRYASITRYSEDFHFVDRIVADSRQVALNHTAGLSTPQQVQLTLFCAFALLDRENKYKKLTQAICQRRMKLLYDGLELPWPKLPHDADYYTEFDLEEWAIQRYGTDFMAFLRDHYEPVDILLRLAKKSSIVLLNGGGFYGPTWSIRVSLANLDDDAYATIGKALHNTLKEYVAEWKQQENIQ